MNKKGVLGLDTVKGFMLILLVVGLIGFLTVIILSNLNTTTDTILTTQTGGVANESLTSVDAAGENLAVRSFSDYRNLACVVSACINDTAEVVIPITNYSTSYNGCHVSWAGSIDDTNNFNSTNWNCTYTYTYVNPEASEVYGNITEGTTKFFSNATTWFTLLTVVIIILIIAVVIYAVNKFSGWRGTETL